MGFLRIIGGDLKGRKINFPEVAGIRPVESKFRRSFFDIISSMGLGGIFMDLFAGSGIMGFEAVSRGFDLVIFVERQKKLIFSIKEYAEKLNIEQKVRIISGVIPKILNKIKLDDKPDIVFLDPYYETDIVEETVEALLSNDLLKEDTIISIKHSKRERYEMPGMEMVVKRIIGDSVLTMVRQNK